MSPSLKLFLVAVAATSLFLYLVMRPQTLPAYRTVTQLNHHHPISIIYVDEASQKALGKFPIDRRYFGELVTRLSPAKPRFVVLKFFFTDPRPGDAALIQALQSVTNVLTQFGGVPQDEGYSVAQLARWSRGSNTFSFPDFPHAWPPTPELAKAFTAAGTVNLSADHGFSLVTSIRGIVYPSLPLAVLEQELATTAVIHRDQVTVGKISVPLRPDGTFTFDLSEPGKLYPAYSFVEVLTGRVPAATFSNQIVLVFAKTPDAPSFQLGYPQPHDAAELVADTINTVLKQF
jgi:CHASE2 domain-containing sensor protein